MILSKGNSKDTSSWSSSSIMMLSSSNPLSLVLSLPTFSSSSCFSSLCFHILLSLSSLSFDSGFYLISLSASSISVWSAAAAATVVVNNWLKGIKLTTITVIGRSIANSLSCIIVVPLRYYQYILVKDYNDVLLF